MRFKIDPRDVPADFAARRLGMTLAAFRAALPNLIARGFPAQDPDTGNFDLTAVDRWCDARHPHLFGAPATVGPRRASDVVAGRLATLRAGNGA